MIYTITLNPAVDKEYLIPDFAFDQVTRANATRIDLGGKGFNVSRLLKIMGTESVALAFAGGHCGSLLRDGLFRLGIPTDFTWISGETRANISILDSRRRRYLKINEAGPTVTETDFHNLLARVLDLAAPGDWWVFGGSLPPGAPADSYAQLITAVQNKGGRALLDSSGPALALGCRAAPFLVKPNQAETAELTGLPVGSTAELAAAAQAVRALGPAHVVISRGAAGALLASGAGVWLAESPAVPPGNPTGAGDALVGGLVWALAREETLVNALAWGVACGAAGASQPGTGMGARAEIEALRAHINPVPLP